MGIYLSYARYEEIKQIVVELFVKYDVSCVPVNGFELATKMDVKVIPYSAIPESKLWLLLKKSEDGFSVEKNVGEWYIYYNDKKDYGRINNTIMHEIGHIVLEPKDPKASRNLPERSNTPGTAYIKLSPTGTFSQLRVFGADRLPVYDIDYGKHQGKTSLHIHFHDGDLSHARIAIPLKPGDNLYEKYKSLFKGVK